MKRSELKRKTPLVAKQAFTRNARLPRVSTKRAAALANGAKVPRQRATGPTPAVRNAVAARSAGQCEWPGCVRAATDVHHRLNRKAGGRHGAMAALINGVAWLLHACRPHHEFVTSPHGEARVLALATGWLLLEGQDAELVPVRTRHAVGPVWLTAAGGCEVPS